MKRAILIGLIALTPLQAVAGPWTYFTHPRPTRVYGLTAGTGGTDWEFKPTAMISGTQIRNGTTDVLSAAGPALTLQRTTINPDGSNPASFSVSAALLFLFAISSCARM